MLTFAYGMNTDPSSMGFYEDVEAVGAGILHGWKFEFRTFADVQEDENEKVHGVVWKVDTLDWLDSREGYPRLYDRKLVPVTLRDGSTVEAWVYTMTPETLRTGLYEAPPQSYYLDMLHAGYKAFDIPTTQVENALKKEEQHA